MPKVSRGLHKRWTRLRGADYNANRLIGPAALWQAA